MQTKHLRTQLAAMAEPGYRDFQSRLMPDNTLPVLGVRLPALRKMARALVRSIGPAALEQLGRETFEEVMLRGMVIGQLYPTLPAGQVIALAGQYLHEIEGWALCDSFCAGLRPLAQAQPDCVWAFAVELLGAPQPYAVRGGIVLLLSYFSQGPQVLNVLALLRGVQCSHFYVKMALAWALASCFAGNGSDAALDALANWPDDWVRRKAVQKIRESLRVPDAVKEKARALLNGGAPLPPPHGLA